MATPPTDYELGRIFLTMMTERQKLTIEDARTLYLFGPTTFSQRTSQGIVTAHLRTSLDAVLGDTRRVVGRDEHGAAQDYDGSRCWLGACGYLMLLDQLASVFDYDGYEHFLRSELGRLPVDEAGAIYGLRNAFIHSYGLANDAENVPNERDRWRRRHVFNLNVGGTKLVQLGDRTDVLTKPLADLPPTVVDLGLLGDLAERIVADIRERHLSGGKLKWRVTDVPTFVGQSFFTHGDPI